jgi:hypothetical protein
MRAITISRAASRVTLVGIFALVIVLAIVLWPDSASDTSGAPVTVAKFESVRGLPAGSATCDSVYPDIKLPFSAGARGTPMTSCRFVEETRRAYATKGSAASQTSQLTVVSPATRKSYTVVCFPTGEYVTCSGGQGAIIYLYNKP